MSVTNENIQSDAQEIDEIVHAMKLCDIKDELKRRKLKSSGNKPELIARLKQAMITENGKVNENDKENNEQDDEENDEKDDEEDDEKDDEEDDEKDDEEDDDEEDEEEDEGDDVVVKEKSSTKKKVLKKRDKYVPTFKDVEESMETFDGDSTKNVRHWIRDFEETAELCEWTEVQKIIYAKRLLRGAARSFVNFENCGKTWKKLKQNLIDEFAQNVTSYQTHKELTRRKKKHNESYQEYVYAMIAIASQADIESAAIIRYIIDGIQDDEVSKATLYGAKSIRQLKAKLREYEERKASEKNKSKHDDQRKKKNFSKSTDAKRYFNCGEEDHVSSACPSKKKGTKCFQCNQFGHIATNCPVKKSKTEPDKSCNLTHLNGKRNIKNVIIENNELSALFDSGSDISLIRVDKYIELGAPRLDKRKIQFRGVGCENNSTLGSTQVKIMIDGISYDATLHLVSDKLIQYDLVIGSDFLCNVDMHLRAGEIKISKIENKDAETSKTSNTDVPEIFNIDVTDDAETVELSHIQDNKIKTELQNMINNYKPQKSRDVNVKMRIVTKDETPVYQRPRRLSPSEKREVDTQIKRWLDDGIIKPSTSEYASPIVLVKKKDGTTRICIDYRKLNEKIIKDRYPLPRIDDQIDQLQDAKVYSTIDLKNGFFHTPIEKSSTKFTAFVTPNGQYEFLRVPFGLSNSPAVFQKYINAVFKEFIEKGSVLVYMDDLIIPSKDVVEGLHKLKDVLDVASQYGLIINWKKCCFMQTKILYLGHEIENGSIRPSEQKTKAVVNFPKPNNAKAVQSFLGLTGYFRKFINDYSVIARPLTNLLRKDVKFKFEEGEERAFRELKHALTVKPVLRLYRVGAETELHTDASALGYGAILLQKDNDSGAFHPVYYMSGKTTAAEENYTSYELEVLAIVKALKKFRVYLLGTSFKIITDCKAFTLTMKKKDLCVRVARWALLLEEFDYSVEHRSGKRMCHVDALSRNPLCTIITADVNDECAIAKFRKAQIEDDDLKKIFNDAERNKNGYVVKSGVLYKNVDDEFLIVIPKRMQTNVIKQAHEQGHFSVCKTEKLIRRDFWFPKMRSKIENIIQNCVNCIIASRKGGKQEGFLHTIDKGEYPLQTYHVDHLGPIPSTKKSYRYIFAVVDAFSKFTWLYPTKSTDTAEVIDRLKRQAVTFGNPARIISDRGTAFTSVSFEEYCKKEGIEHVKITTGVPRSNGQIERINRILISLLSKLSHPKPEDWYKFVGIAQQYLNNTPSRSTGFAPFRILVGTRMRMKEDLQIRNILEQEEAILFEDDRDEVRKQAAKSISKVQAENKKRYDRDRKKPTLYKENDFVAIKRTQYGPGLKLRPKYFGPYRITKTLRNDRFLVEKVGDHEGPNKTSTSIDHMKRWADDVDDEFSDLED